MTSNDRHASHDSPYRTGQHVPLSQSRHAPLTSVATSATESRPDLTSYEDEPSKAPASANPSANGWAGSPTRAYSPGMRSLTSQQRRSNEQKHTPEGIPSAEIQMQSFHDGAPPPPSVTHSWNKIERWVEKNYEELFDQLCEGCTQNDINELEHELDCTLPLEVRESLQVHDGQERGGLPTGILFGCMLLDCEEIVQEWKNWRTVNEEFLGSSMAMTPQLPSKAFGGSSGFAGSSQPASNLLWRQDLLERQESQPLRAIQKSYSHPGWIPLARDWGGNNIAVDLAPGPAGKWGQVIIFGRDYDCKYVVARSWAAFLAVVADDLNSDKVFVDEDTSELKLREFRSQNVEPPYLEILRWRVDQKHGRRPPRRKPTNGLGLNTNLARARDSPYGSPAPSEERGRSPHRPNRGPNQSPKTPFGISSPLARVTEEVQSPVAVGANFGEKDPDGAAKDMANASQSEDLLEISTPIAPNKHDDSSHTPNGISAVEKPTKQETVPEKALQKEPQEGPSTGLGTGNISEMKTVAI
ncbi:SMI1 / KNR4 family (SUKH-1) domain containing protein [Elaphomyces granulatus]